MPVSILTWESVCCFSIAEVKEFSSNIWGVFIDQMQIWPTTKYSFVLVLIGLTSLVNKCKTNFIYWQPFLHSVYLHCKFMHCLSLAMGYEGELTKIFILPVIELKGTIIHPEEVTFFLVKTIVC